VKNLFHLGFPKCGSTTLQKSVFPYLSDYLYVGLSEDLNVGIDTKKSSPENPYNNDPTLRLFYSYILDEEFSKDNCEKIDTVIRDLELKYGKNKKHLLFSHEAMLSNRLTLNGLLDKIDILEKISLDADFLVVTRSIVNISKSLYRDQPYVFIENRKVPCSYFEFWEEQFKLGEKGVLLELCHNYLLHRLRRFARVTVLDLTKDVNENVMVCNLLGVTPESLHLMLSQKQNSSATSINLCFRKIAIFLNSYIGFSNYEFINRPYKVIAQILNRVGSPTELKTDAEWENRLLSKVNELEEKLNVYDA
jgi:hypothetical protein